MSVQAGIWNFDGRPVDQKLLADLSESLEHQGPDDESFHVDGSIALLYRPFHTTADSRREKQPYISHRGFILTWDGRLDNGHDLIADLRSDLETNPTDIAIVAAAFDRWETDCFRRIIGDWAVSVWKPEHRELILGVDYMAIRHIFYYLTRARIWWSTDLSQLVLLSGDKFHIDDNYIAGYFAHDPDAHLTPYREIREVPPGQFVCIRNGCSFIERYWRFNPRCRLRYRTDAEYEEHFRHVFRQSIQRRLRSDSPVVAELSGGLDSSSIVCMADDILSNKSGPILCLDTLSYYDRTEPGGDDWIYLQKIEAQRRRIGVHIDAGKVGRFPASLEYSQFEPQPGQLGYARELDAQRADVLRKGGYRVVLSGLGGDEFMGGIPNPEAHLADLIVRFRFITLTRQLVAWALVRRQPCTHIFSQSLLALLPAFIGRHFLKQAKVESWINEDFARRTKLSARLLDVDDHFGCWLPTRRSYIAGVVLMANKMAKRRSPPLEEVRYPYLDQDVIEFVLSIPADQLLRPGERRSLMRRSLVGIVPQDVLSRKTKQVGARTPIVGIEKNLAQAQSLFDSPVSSRLGYVIDIRFLERLHAAIHGTEISIVRALRTISLEIWLRDLSSRDLIDTPMRIEATA